MHLNICLSVSFNARGYTSGLWCFLKQRAFYKNLTKQDEHLARNNA